MIIDVIFYKSIPAGFIYPDKRDGLRPWSSTLKLIYPEK